MLLLTFCIIDQPNLKAVQFNLKILSISHGGYSVQRSAQATLKACYHQGLWNSGCCRGDEQSYAARYCMQQGTVCSKVLYAARYCMQQGTVCSKVLYAARYCMQQRTVCSKVLYAARYCMQQGTVCSKVLYAARYCMTLLRLPTLLRLS